MIIQGIPNSALRLGVKGREDSTSARSLLLRRGVLGSRPMKKAAGILLRRGVIERRPSVMNGGWLIKAGKLLPLDPPPPWGDGGEVVAWIVGRIDCAGRKSAARRDLVVGMDDDMLGVSPGELLLVGFGVLVD